MLGVDTETASKLDEICLFGFVAGVTSIEERIDQRCIEEGMIGDHAYDPFGLGLGADRHEARKDVRPAASEYA